MVGFSGGMGVEGLEVNRSSWCAIFLSTDDHPMAPGDWFSDRHRF